MTEQDDSPERPTPGLKESVPSWLEYGQIQGAIHDYLDHEPDNPQWQDIWRALEAIMGVYQRDAFVEAFDVDDPAEKVCLRRLITGKTECPPFHHSECTAVNRL